MLSLFFIYRKFRFLDNSKRTYVRQYVMTSDLQFRGFTCILWIGKIKGNRDYRIQTDHHVKCVILALTIMLKRPGKKKVKTDKRDVALIARCLAHHDYHSVHVPIDMDKQVKEFIRMRDDHKLALKKIKQQILAFCLRHNYRYEEGSSKRTIRLKISVYENAMEAVKPL